VSFLTRPDRPSNTADVELSLPLPLPLSPVDKRLSLSVLSNLRGRRRRHYGDAFSVCLFAIEPLLSFAAPAIVHASRPIFCVATLPDSEEPFVGDF